MRALVCGTLLWVCGAAWAGETVALLDAPKTPPKEAAGFFQDRERGWFWYEDPVEEIEEEEKKGEPAPAPAAAAQPAVPAVLSPREMLKKQGEEWEDAMANAILNPSRETYVDFLARTAHINQQAETFATGFKQAIWLTPEYDYTLEKPRNSQAIIAQNEAELKLRVEELRGLSETNGLLFFFRSDCPFCHRFAPILKRFSEEYGFTVIPVSLDGQGIPEYPYPKPNYEMGRQLNVEVVPAVFMVNPGTNSVATVGYGFNDWSALTTKVLFAAQQLNGSAMVKEAGL